MRKGQLATGYWLLARNKSDVVSPSSGRWPVASGQLAGHARGFTLVAALFLIVVVAALGAFAVRMNVGQQQTVNLSLFAARALAAANSGIEFGAYQALKGSGCASATLNLTEAGLNGFTVSVTCTSTTHSESGGTTKVFRIDATATAGTYGQPDYVSRHVYATFTDVT